VRGERAREAGAGRRGGGQALTLLQLLPLLLLLLLRSGLPRPGLPRPGLRHLGAKQPDELPQQPVPPRELQRRLEVAGARQYEVSQRAVVPPKVQVDGVPAEVLVLRRRFGGFSSLVT
jgi:hypothetical protein